VACDNSPPPPKPQDVGVRGGIRAVSAFERESDAWMTTRQNEFGWLYGQRGFEKDAEGSADEYIKKGLTIEQFIVPQERERSMGMGRTCWGEGAREENYAGESFGSFPRAALKE